MEVTTRIRRPLADEHVIGTDPPLQPELADVWRRRINPFAGRAISDKALTAEQDVRSGMQRVVGLALAAGSVEGLEVLLDAGAIGSEPEAALFQVAPGLGITRSGEDVGVGALRQLSFGMLPVVLRTDHADKLEGEGAPDEIPVPASARPSDEPEGEMGSMAARLRPVRPRRLGQTLAEIAANPESGLVPHVGVLVAQPVTATILGRPVDECPPDPRDDAYADLQRIDGCRLVFYLWPDEVTAIDGGPDYALPAIKGAIRNRLAYSVFDTEKLLEADEMHPWEEWGVPLALAAFDDRWQLSFIDRFAVARIGGTPKARTAMAPKTGEARLWQARIDQFVHHLADLPDLREERLREEFVRLPPVGLLPPDMFDPVLRRQHFFPGNYGVSAVPVPRSNLELAVSEAASLASFNRGTPDRVEMLVPVPDHVYDPGLLEVAVEDPRFTEAITAFREDRATWLSRREGARRRYDRLMESVTGLVTGWALADLPMEENSPAPRTQVPIEISRTRRFNEQSAARTHVMVGAHATLPVAKSDTIWVWLRIHSDTQMTGLSLRLGAGTGLDPAGPFAAGVYWGEPAAMPIASEQDLEVRRQGDLPEVGVWHRLEVPASAIWMIDGGNLDGFSVNGVEFTQRGGEVEWGSFGKTDVNGLNYTYIGDDAPAGATLTTSGATETGWPWRDVEDREGLTVPDFGTVRTVDVRRVGAIDGFRTTWTQDFLAADIAKIDEGGLSEFLAEVEGRLKATNDAVDLGFVRARSDIYRVRQIMLGADSASRLVTSPSLADLAARDEGARATSRGIADFLANVGLTGAPGAQQPPPITAAQAQVSTQAQQPLMLMSAAFSPRIMTLNTATTLEARRVTSLSTSSFATLAAVSSPSVARVSAPAVAAPSVTAAATTPLFAGPSTFAATGFAATFQPAMSLTAARFAMDETRYRPRDIQLQLPVAGLVERTASVAERLTASPAVQALNYAIATKGALIETLSNLRSSNNSRPDGIYLEDIPMPGFAKREIQPNDAIVLNEAAVPTLAELLTDRLSQHRQFEDTDRLPQGDKHESDYFTAAVRAIDNSIAIMRLVEGRIALFEQLAQHIRDLRQEILDLADQAAAYLRSIDVEVEEARHDLTMAQQLRAEEQARVDATNARRGNVLATHVQAVAWRRVRECDHRTLAPALEIGSALAEDPVIACRREHEDVADEIEDYVDLLRDAPVRWFPRIAREVDRIQRLEAARAAIEAMRYRAMIPLRFFAPPPPTAPRFLRGVHNALLTQRRLVEERRITIQQMNLSLLHTLSLAQSQVQIRQMATIGDLLDNRHRQPALTRMASEEIDGIETVAGCLHESFGEVAPIIRLRWAEDLSEFDRPAPLHSLAGLPGWPEVPLEQRRTLQSFVDWLFRRIDRNDQEATDAINELIRICLLMASHAPVDRLIPAQLVEPAPARVGGRIHLALDISRVRRGMIALIRDRNDQIVSRAVIEDLIDGHASAVITQNLQAVTTISTDMRFQLMSGKA